MNRAFAQLPRESRGFWRVAPALLLGMAGASILAVSIVTYYHPVVLRVGDPPEYITFFFSGYGSANFELLLGHGHVQMRTYVASERSPEWLPFRHRFLGQELFVKQLGRLPRYGHSFRWSDTRRVAAVYWSKRNMFCVQARCDIPVLALLVGAYPLYWLLKAVLVSRRRLRLGLCYFCGYYIKGTCSDACSECGRVIVRR